MNRPRTRKLPQPVLEGWLPRLSGTPPLKLWCPALSRLPDLCLPLYWGGMKRKSSLTARVGCWRSTSLKLAALQVCWPWGGRGWGTAGADVKLSLSSGCKKTVSLKPGVSCLFWVTLNHALADTYLPADLGHTAQPPVKETHNLYTLSTVLNI